MKKILVSFHVPDEALGTIRREYEIVYPDAEKRVWNHEELMRKIRGCDAMLAVGAKVDRALLDANPNLVAVANSGVGYDNIDWQYATEKKIAVINTPNTVLEPTAELTIAIMLDALRRVSAYDRALRASLVAKTPPFYRYATTAYGKTLGIIGFGRIGRAVAQKALGLGMKVVYNDVVEIAPELNQANAQYMSKEDVIKSCDVLSLHCPYFAENHHLISAREFEMMKPDAYLVNAARGPIVDEAALIHALKNNIIAGAALDVFEYEPTVTKELAELENIVIVPHVGTQCYDVRIAMVAEALQGLAACLRGERPYNMVNAEAF